MLSFLLPTRQTWEPSLCLFHTRVGSPTFEWVLKQPLGFLSMAVSGLVTQFAKTSSTGLLLQEKAHGGAGEGVRETWERGRHAGQELQGTVLLRRQQQWILTNPKTISKPFPTLSPTLFGLMSIGFPWCRFRGVASPCSTTVFGPQPVSDPKKPVRKEYRGGKGGSYVWTRKKPREQCGKGRASFGLA